jgi:TRAP-type C4-dicarboxylate transport system permease small subunit
MGKSTALYVAVFSAATLAIGWYGARAWIAHGDVGATAKKIPGMKKARIHNGSIAVVVAVVVVLVFWALLKK